jgi:hypothetical protein
MPNNPADIPHDYNNSFSVWAHDLSHQSHYARMYEQTNNRPASHCARNALTEVEMSFSVCSPESRFLTYHQKIPTQLGKQRDESARYCTVRVRREIQRYIRTAADTRAVSEHNYEPGSLVERNQVMPA